MSRGPGGRPAPGSTVGSVMVGRLAQVWRHPVKSLLGERLITVEVGVGGVSGDRRWALVHRETGLVASAKHPRRWRKLLTLHATGADPEPVRITLPEGRVVRVDDPDVNAMLSTALGEPVTLAGTAPPDAALDRADPDGVLAGGVSADVPVVRGTLGLAAPPGSFFDFAPVHLVTTATLDRIGAQLPGGTVDARRYRPNLVLDVDVPGFAENDWVGRELRIGAGLVLRVLAPTPRCAVPTLAHGPLPGEPDALRVPARLNRVVPLEPLGPQPCVGAYAQVIQAGRVAVGDAVALG